MFAPGSQFILLFNSNYLMWCLYCFLFLSTLAPTRANPFNCMLLCLFGIKYNDIYTKLVWTTFVIIVWQHLYEHPTLYVNCVVLFSTSYAYLWQWPWSCIPKGLVNPSQVHIWIHTYVLSLAFARSLSPPPWKGGRPCCQVSTKDL